MPLYDPSSSDQTNHNETNGDALPMEDESHPHHKELTSSKKKKEEESSTHRHWTDSDLEFTIRHWDITASSMEQSLRELLDRLQDIDHWTNNPDIVLRFLRARTGNVNAAEKMFRNMVQWRVSKNVDKILDEYHPPIFLKENLPGAILKGVDKDGDPIYVGRLGVTDAAGLLRTYGEEELIRYNIWLRESVLRGQWLKEYRQEQGKPVKRMTIIEDLHGLSILHSSKAVLNLYGKIMRFDQDNYPEVGKRLLILRAPFIFRAVWSLAKHFFDEGVVAKMTFTSSSDYQTVLERYIDPAVLPSEIFPERGQGQVVTGMTYNFKGGKVP